MTKQHRVPTYPISPRTQEPHGNSREHPHLAGDFISLDVIDLSVELECARYGDYAPHSLSDEWRMVSVMVGIDPVTDSASFLKVPVRTYRASANA